MSRRIVLALLLCSLLLSLLSLSLSKSSVPDPDEEDLSFLEDEDVNGAASHEEHDPDADFGDDEFGSFDDFEDENEFSPPAVDEKDVVVLKESNFSDVIGSHKHVMVEFYAPWCGHCQSLAPEYAAAATELKSDGLDVVLAKVDATEETELSNKYDVQGFPRVLFFVDGNHKPYTGERTKDGIISWIKKKTGPSVYNITTTDEAENILTSEKKVVLAYLDSLTGTETDQLAAASRDEDDVNFYQTMEPDVAKLFSIDPDVQRPVLVLLKEDAEKISYFNGQFGKFAISEFVFAHKLPLVTTFTRESASSIFESQIKKQLLLFTTANDSNKFLPIFEEAAKLYKGKILFVYVQLDNEDIGKPVADYFGVTGDGPTILAYTGNEDARKFVLKGEVTLDNIKAFVDDFLEEKLKPFYKSDPIPETNDGDVKIIVGNNFDDIVLDESKDVLFEIYAPWCGHCQSLEPTYNKLARHLRGINSIVIAKMDGTTNEHPRAKADGFPTILFFPAGNKSFDPITVDTDRTVVAFYKFLKKHAAIPFKLPKLSSTLKEKSDKYTSDSISAKDLKDEL